MGDMLSKIMSYEAGEMDEDEEISFFQELITSGLCWRLQGHYGRTAQGMLEAGLCSREGERLN